jgi:hypothetical protein
MIGGWGNTNSAISHTGSDVPMLISPESSQTSGLTTQSQGSTPSQLQSPYIITRGDGRTAADNSTEVIDDGRYDPIIDGMFLTQEEQRKK